MANKKLTEEEENLLKEVVEHFYKEDSTVRERQIKTWKQLKLFWENFQRSWYSEVAHDWRVYDLQNAQGESDDQSFYDKPVNIYRAYLESIIAALSVTIPPIKCFPDDADNPLDISTAKAGDKIAELVYRHNDVPLLWIHGLFVYMTEGMTACYAYPHEDVKYGIYDDKKYEELEEMHEYKKCPNCGEEIDDRLIEQEADEFMPDDEDAGFHDIIFNEGQELCPACSQMVDPQLSRSPLVITRLVGVTKKAKTRVCMETYGGLNVKVANYARKQGETPYLTYSYEAHYAQVLEEYPDLRDDDSKHGRITGGSGGGSELYERYARLSPQYHGEYPENNVTIRKTWLRPCAFNVLKDDDEVKKLREKFPDGCKVTLINDEFAEAQNEALDDYWTLTYNPLADHLHHDPAGLLLVSVQEITNDLISLVLQTIEHGIPQTFADPAVLNTEQYRQLEATPGSIIPTKAISSNRRVSEGFYEIKTATLSGEVLPFAQMIQELAQLVSGALPSLFGGVMQGGGETASEYSMSKAQALQRLQTTWKIITLWWKNVFGKVIPIYIKNVHEDEKDVQRGSDGNFINVFIRKAELEGKLGKVELEANENLPLTWTQTKDVVMQLLNGGNPEILAMLGHPDNLPVIREAIGLVDFYVPGEDDRNAEYDEIKLLLASEPIKIPTDPMQMQMGAAMGQEIPPEQEIPSIEIDPMLDNHGIRFEIDKKWALSEAGRQAKVDNPEGYKNVLLHAKMHYEQLMMQMMQQQQTQEGEGSAPPKKSNPKDKPAPIQGEEDVQTIQ